MDKMILNSFAKQIMGRVWLILVIIVGMTLLHGSPNVYAEDADGNNKSVDDLGEPVFITYDDGEEYMCLDIVEFGRYPQSDPSGKTSDSIRWRVMEVSGDSVLLWADSILDYRVFNNKDFDERCWDTSDIREWLMNDFAETAFSFDERMAISYVDHIIQYPESSSYATVKDTVFLPDMNELYELNYKDGPHYIAENRSFLYWRYASAYAHLTQVKAGYTPKLLDGYWLRTPGNSKGVYRYVKQDLYNKFNWESVWYNSSIDSANVVLGICPMVYVSKRYLQQTLSSVETYVAIPYDEYEPPYKDTVWVKDGLGAPRYETLEDGSHEVIYDIVEMGSYPQTDPLGKSSDPIKWRVMDVTETKIMLMADSIIDYRWYNESAERDGIYWGSSDIRRWLNENFYYTAFSESEREEILETVHDTGSKKMNSVYSGISTDRLMLPAYDDIYEWIQEGQSTLSKKEQTAVLWRYPTAYSYRKYKRNSGQLDDWIGYWLSTAGDSDGYYMMILEKEYEGDIIASYSGINTSNWYVGVCPVMFVNRSDAGIYQKTGEINVSTIDEIELPFSGDVAELEDGDTSGQGTGGGSGNTDIGEGSGSGTEGGSGNAAIGEGSGSGTEGGSGNTGIGEESGSETEEGRGNAAIGEGSGSETEEGVKNDSSGTGDEAAGNVYDSGTSNIIEMRDIKDTIIGDIDDQIYMGEALRPELSLMYNGVTLVKDADYTVTYSNNINTGIAYANITGCGEYSGFVRYAFAINPRVIDGLNTILKGRDGTIYKAVYTGKAIRPKTSFRLPISEADDTKRLSPEEGKDYAVSYANNRKIGVATITYRFYGNYTGIVTKEFQIVPGKVTKLSAKQKGSKTVLSWKKVKGASGYEILRASKKNGKYKRIARIGNKIKYVDKKAKGKKYYYKVRAFGKNKGVRYYGEAVVVKAK